MGLKETLEMQDAYVCTQKTPGTDNQIKEQMEQLLTAWSTGLIARLC